MNYDQAKRKNKEDIERVRAAIRSAPLSFMVTFWLFGVGTGALFMFGYLFVR
jgi:hypothetical protein